MIFFAPEDGKNYLVSGNSQAITNATGEFISHCDNGLKSPILVEPIQNYNLWKTSTFWHTEESKMNIKFKSLQKYFLPLKQHKSWRYPLINKVNRNFGSSQVHRPPEEQMLLICPVFSTPLHQGCINAPLSDARGLQSCAIQEEAPGHTQHWALNQLLWGEVVRQTHIRTWRLNEKRI